MTGISTLDQIDHAFTLAATDPNPVTVPGHLTGGHRHQHVAVTELRKFLLHRGTPAAARDEVWAYVIGQVRTGGTGTWTVLACGLALPGLRHAATRVIGIWPASDQADAQSEVLTGFLTALNTVDVDEPRICSRLIGAAFSAGRTWARGHIHTTRAAMRIFESRTPPPAAGHVDLVLADAIGQKVISPTEAHLIGATRLDRQTLASVAAQTGRSISDIRLARKHAEAALIEWLL